MPTIVQFIHPGPEHGPDQKGGSHKSWNVNPHKRKFLSAKGDYVRGDTLHTGEEMCFWGEWEPPSQVEPAPPPTNRYPKWLHRPYLPSNYKDLVKEVKGRGGAACKKPAPSWCAPPCGEGLQNTAPLVFGPHFLYGLCQQASKPTMRELEAGSLILFGTGYTDGGEFRFHLDTLFVVARYEDYKPAGLGALKLSQGEELYREITLKTAFSCGKGPKKPHRLYWGAAWSNKFEGMYSFSPAKPHKPGQAAMATFSPVVLAEAPYISHGLPQGINQTPNRPLSEIQKIWQSILDQCRQAGCAAGVRFDQPPIVP